MYCTVRNIIIFTGLFTTGLAHAYVGPGAGLSAIGSVLALIGAVFLLVVGFLWYPIKRILRRGKRQNTEKDAKQRQADSED